MMIQMNDSCKIRLIDHDDDKSSCLVLRKASPPPPPPPPFLLKTYMLVEDPGTDEVISWNGEGKAFVVWQPAEFSRDLLPTLFKHSNFSSFVRQLNTYGFHKVATNRWEFSNDMFRKGERDKLCQIRRRSKAAAAACSNNITTAAAAPTKDHTITHDHSSDDNDNDNDNDNDINIELDQIWSSSSSSDHELLFLIQGNKRLKQENQVLSSELALMKKKCKQLVDLVAIYEQEEEEEECTVDDHEYQILEETNVINTTVTDQGPKLFGVRLINSLINTSSPDQEEKETKLN